VDAGAAMVGINHRDLKTLKIDLSISKRILPLIPRQIETLVVESGIKEPNELAGYRDSGVHAVLIGEALMRRSDPEAAVRSYVDAGANTARKTA
jgi:indole-3-glycerol phosphate synthase